MILLLGLAAFTLVSEDLAAISAGLLVARGQTSFLAATLACFLGIYIGDLLLFLAGRHLGRPFLARAPLKWLVGPDEVERASRWLDRRGVIVVALSRLTPGTRLPTYVAAGMLRTRFSTFALSFALAAAVWTPLLVGAAALAGAAGLARIAMFRRFALLFVVLGALALLAVVKLAVPLCTRRGRRLLYSSWKRATRWEFWPPWVFYPPVVLYALALGIKHRSLTVFKAANPGMEDGGFVGESKSTILDTLQRGGAPVARFVRIPASDSAPRRLEAALAFQGTLPAAWPIVLKPDQGERGRNVSIVRDPQELARRLGDGSFDWIVQEYVPGVEYGIFYVRHPDEERGRIFSITEKRLPRVLADGVRSVERLILEDPRGVCMARFHLRRLAARLDEIPAAGESIALAEIGNHCRGALFLDGSAVLTPALTEATERASRAHPGFHFGRYDVCSASIEDLRAGRFTILELNGVSSESTDIYDPAKGVFAAWRKLFAQWRLAFEIGAANRARSAPR